MTDVHEDPVDTGTAALKAGDWIAATDAFRAALVGEETPEALAGLGEALWWLGETQASVEYREQAYAQFRRRPDPAQAANLALGLSIHYQANVGNAAASAGWLSRAKRLIEEASLDGFDGWIALFEAGETGDPVAMESRTRDALRIARDAGDIDVELCALAQLGSSLVSQGRIDEGIALLDEAMAGSLGGEGGNFDTVVFTCCNMVDSCTRCADFERAVQWIQAAERFTKRYGCPFLYLYCRIHYAAILIATGNWAEADELLTAAIRDAEGSQRPLHAYACATLAALRLSQGRIEDAGDLLEEFDEEGPAAPVAAALHLARGAPTLASAVARRALDAADFLDRSVLLELLAEAKITESELDEAISTARAMSEEGAARSCALVRARGLRLLGRALGGRDDLEAAVTEFARIGLPYEVARTRMLLANVTRADEPKLAEAEARAALAIFEKLGAGRDADAAASLLRDLGVKAARIGPRQLGKLTKRESEVLTLVGEGLSNPEIAQRLYLSRKTVEHHVAAILTKLGARNRAEASRILREGITTK